MVSPSQLAKIFHSLRFQLPAVVLVVFMGILFLLMLFFHEMTNILVKTRQVAHSADVNDYVSGWLNTLSSSARERIKLESLGDYSYLRTFQSNLKEINTVYAMITSDGADTTLPYMQSLHVLHEKHLEYIRQVDRFAVQETNRMKALRKSLATAPLLGKKSKVPHKAVSVSKKRTWFGMKPSQINDKALVVRPKDIELDKATNEAFMAFEQSAREGLFQTQEVMREERRDKLMSLRNSVGRSKGRLFYSLFLLLGMVGYLAIILKWKILDPMKSLRRGVVEIGKGALGHQIKVGTRNEIGELAVVFNQMSTQLDEKQNAETRLRRLEAIEQIVRSVNHEINNPLMIISGNAEYLLAILETSDEGTKTKLQSIVSEVRRIFLVTQRLKEIKEPMVENYIGTSDQMIDLARSSQILKRDP